MTSDGMKATITEFFRRISAAGVEPIGELFTSDGIYDGAYSPHKHVGSEHITNWFRECLPQVLHPFHQWPVEIAVASSELAFVEYQSRGTVVGDGSSYQNRYAAPVHFRDGKISYMREYYNPVFWSGVLGETTAAAIAQVFPHGLPRKSPDEAPWVFEMQSPPGLTHWIGTPQSGA